MRGRGLVYSLFAAGVPLLAASYAAALGVQCPVCGQTVEEGVDVCPNDGTDLKLLGKPAELDTDSLDTDSDAADREAIDPASESDRDGVHSPTRESESGGYKRRDDIGGRKTTDRSSSGSNDAAYADRQSRLPGDSRTAAPVKRRRVRRQMETPAPPVEDDRLFFADYQRKQRYLWEARQSDAAAASQQGRDREAARKRLLSSLAAPIASLGARVFFMGEEAHPGPVSGAEIDLHFARYRLRAGFSTFLGIRALESRNELIFLESLSVGGQIPGRFSPFIVAKGGVGMSAAERFETDRAFLLTALGAEAGADAWIHPWLSMTPSFGFVRCTMANVYWYSFTFKLSVGF